jgi:ABC transporter substrate binding protein
MVLGLRGSHETPGFHRGSWRHSGDAAFATLARERLDALFVAADAFFAGRRVQLAKLAARDGIPATYSNRDYVTDGALMSSGTDFADTYRQMGAYIGRILKGAKPADLPVVQLNKFEFVINLQTARALGIEVPPGLLTRADEVTCNLRSPAAFSTVRGPSGSRRSGIAHFTQYFILATRYKCGNAGSDVRSQEHDAQ